MGLDMNFWSFWGLVWCRYSSKFFWFVSFAILNTTDNLTFNFSSPCFFVQTFGIPFLNYLQWRINVYLDEWQGGLLM